MAGKENKSGRPRSKLRLWHIGLALLCLAAFEVLSMRHHWRAEFHQQVEALRAAGFPVTAEELDASYPWPQAGENAAHWVMGAASLQRKLDPEQAKPVESLLARVPERPRPAESLAADRKTALEQYLGDNSKALASLHEAVTIAECRYPVDFSKGAGTAVQHISEVRDGCRLLCQEAILRAENKDPNGAAQAVEAVLRVAGTLDKEPVVFSYLTRMDGASRATVALERILSQVPLTEPQLAHLQKMFLDIRPDEGLAWAVVGDRCLYLTMFERPQALDRQVFDHLPPTAILEAYNALGLSAREGTVFLDYMGDCLRIIQLPASKRPAALEAVEARFRTKHAILLRHFGSLSFSILREAHYAAPIEMAVAALAVERYRLARGSLPETLDQLVPDYLPAVPEDPFDGAPLRYQRVDQGFVVYSVGEDRQDDGGKEEPLKKQGESYDLVFRVERPFVLTP